MMLLHQLIVLVCISLTIAIDPLSHEDHIHATDEEALTGTREDDFSDLPPEKAKLALGKLLIKMDVDGDGKISYKELSDWVLNSYNNLDSKEALDKFKQYDNDNDGKLSWAEVLKNVYDMSIEDAEKLMAKDSKSEDDTNYELIAEDVERFKMADLDGNKHLDSEEYKAFLYPYNYDHMRPLEVKRMLLEYDKNNDSEVSFDEFMAFTKDLSEDVKTEEKARFDGYDTNKDGKLSGAELEEWASPSLRNSANEEASHLFSKTLKADGKPYSTDTPLAFDDIVKHHDEWVGSGATDYGSQLHDEL